MRTSRTTDRTPRTANGNPYVGPRPFTHDDVEKGHDLYGRNREVSQLFDLLIATRIVLFYSPSGAGKTSLIQAKLIPKLEDEEFEVLPVIRVGQDPLSIAGEADNLRSANRYVFSLLCSLDAALPGRRQRPVAELAGLDLPTYLQQRWRTEDEGKPLALIFDQFEEILTVNPTDREAKEAFLSQVGEILRDRGRWALFAMREDYVAALDPYLRLLPTRLSSTFRLDLLEEPAALLAIKEPARAAGVEFTDQAAKALVDDLRIVRIRGSDGKPEKQPGLYVEPVQLQVVCHRLWAQKSAGATQIGDLGPVGDVDEILADYYSEQVRVIAGQTGVGERVVREWFDRQLITSEGIRGQILQEPERTGGLDNAIIDELVDAHLVRGEKRRGVTWFELAHDRLIEPIRKDNADWFEQNLSALQCQASVWDREHRPDSYLLRNEELAEAERWVAAHPGELTNSEQEFLNESRRAQVIAERELDQARQLAVETEARLRAEEQRAEEQTRAAMRLRRQRLWLAGLTIAAMGLAGFAGWARHQAIEQRNLAVSYQAAMRARTLLQSNPELALLLALEGLRISPTREASATVGRAFQYIRPPDAFLHDDTGPVTSVAFSPDGATLASSSADATIRLWDTKGTPHGEPLGGHGGKVTSVAFSPDGATLASSSADATVRLWEVATGRLLGEPLQAHSGEVSSVAFSPNGRMLASSGADATIRLWDTQGTPRGEPLGGHGGKVTSVTFSPDGATLASSSADATVRLWEVATGRLLGEPLQAHSGEVSSVAFSRDGRWLASSDAEGTVLLWDRAHQPPSEFLRARAARVTSMAFSPDSKTLAWGSDDGSFQLWDVDEGLQPMVPFPGHAPITSVAFNPNDQFAASGSLHGDVVLWERALGPEYREVYQKYGCSVVTRNLNVAEWSRYFPDQEYREICPSRSDRQ